MPSLRWLDNEVYGHGAILRSAAGVAKPYHILAHVQHGWNAHSGWTLNGTELFPLSAPRIVWGDRQLEWHRRGGHRVPPAIGAPFLYLEKEMEARRAPRSPAVLLFPYHGTKAHTVSCDHRALIAEVRDTESAAVTTCLHPDDFADSALVRAYRELGPVTTMGEKHSAFFLVRMMQLLDGHTRAITNRLSTALFYAARRGLEIGIYGPDARINVETADHGLREMFPDLHQVRVPEEKAARIAAHELGVAHLRGSEELRHLLGLVTVRQTTRAPLLLGTSAARRLAHRVVPAWT